MNRSVFLKEILQLFTKKNLNCMSYTVHVTSKYITHPIINDHLFGLLSQLNTVLYKKVSLRISYFDPNFGFR